MTRTSQHVDRAAARAAKDHVRDLLGADVRVNGVGVTRWQSSYAVRVNVVDGQDAPELPATVDGVPVHVVEVGRVTTQGG
jgi:hypothetical protein